MLILMLRVDSAKRNWNAYIYWHECYENVCSDSHYALLLCVFSFLIHLANNIIDAESEYDGHLNLIDK